MNRILILTAILTVLTPGMTTRAQESIPTITADDAIQAALENNYGILIARNQAEIDKLNFSPGNAGLLPSVELSGSREELFELDTEKEEGTSRTEEKNRTALLSADVELGWTLFDGGKMFVKYNRLKELKNLGQTLAQIEVENTISDVITVYYSIVREQKVLDVLKTSVEISAERYSIAQSKKELGSGTEFEMLLAQADLNTDRGAILRQEVVLNDAKIALIRLLGLDSDSDFNVEGDIPLSQEIKLRNLEMDFSENNKQLDAARARLNISKLELKELQRERLPRLELTTGYTFSREEEKYAPVFWERTRGYYFGLTAKLNLFNGFNQHRKIQISKIEQKNAGISLDRELKHLETQLYSEYKNYTGVVKLVDLESENLQLAQEALDIALDQFRLATITSVELRKTQNILINTENRLIDAQFDAKSSEAELQRLSGVLLRQVLQTE